MVFLNIVRVVGRSLERWISRLCAKTPALTEAQTEPVTASEIASAGAPTSFTATSGAPSTRAQTKDTDLLGALSSLDFWV